MVEAIECPGCGEPLNGIECQTCGFNEREDEVVVCGRCGDRVPKKDTKIKQVTGELGITLSRKRVCEGGCNV